MATHGRIIWAHFPFLERLDIPFGLCNLGMGFPELGYVRMSEITSVRGPLGLSIERDIYFEGEKPLSAYAAEASSAGHILA